MKIVSSPYAESVSEKDIVSKFKMPLKNITMAFQDVCVYTYTRTKQTLVLKCGTEMKVSNEM